MTSTAPAFTGYRRLRPSVPTAGSSAGGSAIQFPADSVVSERGDCLVTFAVALGSVAAMAAVTDMRSAPEAHHDKEQCREEQE